MFLERKNLPSVIMNVRHTSGFHQSIQKIFNINKSQLKKSYLGELYNDESVENEVFLQIPQDLQEQFVLFIDTVFIPQVHKERQIPMEHDTKWNMVASLNEGPAGVFYKIHCDWYAIIDGKRSLGDIFLETVEKYQNSLVSIHSTELFSSEEEKITNFRKTYLSNFAATPIHIGDKTFPTVEHAYQYHKMKYYPDQQIDTDIFLNEEKTPGNIKKTVDSLNLTTNEVWEKEKISIMYMLVYQKFLQHPELRQQLIDTGEKELLEGNKTDVYWGVDEHSLEGSNYLGKILMAIRKELQQQSS